MILEDLIFGVICFTLGSLAGMWYAIIKFERHLSKVETITQKDTKSVAGDSTEGAV